MSLIQTAKLSGNDPCAHLREVLTRLPTQKASDVGRLLPHRWAQEERSTAATDGPDSR